MFSEAWNITSVLHDPVRLIFEMDRPSRYVPRGYERRVEGVVASRVWSCCVCHGQVREDSPVTAGLGNHSLVHLRVVLAGRMGRRIGAEVEEVRGPRVLLVTLI